MYPIQINFKQILSCFIIMLFGSVSAFSQAAGKALLFDETNYVDCGNDTTLQISDEITVEAWSRYDDVSDWWSRIVTKGRWLDRNYGWMLHYSDNNGSKTGLIFTCEIDGFDRTIGTATNELITQGEWNHCAATFDGDSLSLYLNGNLVAQAYYPGSITETDGPYNVQIGRSYHWAEYLEGAVDEVRIWDKALTQAEINSWMYCGITDVHPHWENLKGYWKFDDENNPTGDYSQNNNPGYLMPDSNKPIFIDSDVELPVTLSAFNVLNQNQSVYLTWTTLSETNNSGWNLYRGETLTSFEDNEIAKLNYSLITGAGTSTQINEYSFIDETELIPGNSYYYWLESVSYNGSTAIYGPDYITINSEGEEPENHDWDNEYGLFQNFPNPFKKKKNNQAKVTRVTFKVKEVQKVNISIFNIRGRLIKNIFNETVEADRTNSTFWNGCDSYNKPVKSGIYLIKMKTNSDQQIRKMMIIN